MIFYEFACCGCGHEMQFAPSLAQRNGNRDAGHGHCEQCGLLLKLVITPDGKHGFAKPFDEEEQDIVDALHAEDESNEPPKKS